jgi:hypothetical protein
MIDLPEVLPASREDERFSWCRPGLLEEAVEKDESLVTDHKDHASRPTAGKVRTKLVKPRSERPNERHTNGPTIF